jgi:hypothetical protein
VVVEEIHNGGQVRPSGLLGVDVLMEVLLPRRRMPKTLHLFPVDTSNQTHRADQSDLGFVMTMMDYRQNSIELPSALRLHHLSDLEQSLETVTSRSTFVAPVSIARMDT